MRLYSAVWDVAGSGGLVTVCGCYDLKRAKTRGDGGV
jgi:hypothetical protein